MMEEEDIPASIWGEAVIRTNEDGEYIGCSLVDALKLIVSCLLLFS